MALRIGWWFLRRLACGMPLAGMLSIFALPSPASGAGRANEDLPPETQLKFAVRFAPRLIYSPDEVYFPCNPFLAEISLSEAKAAAEEPAGRRTRAATYRSFALEEKMQRAVIFYHVFLGQAGRIVVEYWIYYVENAYSAKPVIFPIRAGCSHPNDLEHIVFELKPGAGEAPEDGPGGSVRDPSGYVVCRILASAHNINNVYSFPAGRSTQERLEFLVEKGSHAMAPDVDRDMQFEPKDDSDRNRKMIWGVRDRGDTFARYRVQQSDPRPRESSVVLCHTAEDAKSLQEEGFRKVFQFSLMQEDYLDRFYTEMETVSNFEFKTLNQGPGLLKRLFGEPEHGDQLLIPSRHEDFGHPKEMADRRVLRERGFTVGITTMMERNVNLTAGGRWTWPVRRRWAPDLMWDTQVFVTCDKTIYLSTELLGFYPLDAMTNLFAGWGVIVDASDAGRRQPSFLGGLEFRLGRFRIHGALRQVGPLYRHGLDFRLYYLF